MADEPIVSIVLCKIVLPFPLKEIAVYWVVPSKP